MIFEDVIRSLIMVMAVAVSIPVSLVMYRVRSEFRFELMDAIGLAASIGWSLACLHYLLHMMDLDESWLVTAAIAFILLIPTSFSLGFSSRDKLKIQARLWRVVVIWSGYAAPSAFVPAGIFAYSMFVDLHRPLENDLLAALAWLGLVAPPMVQILFWSISFARKDITPP